MGAHQPGILAGLPPAARHLTFQLAPDGVPRPALERLAKLVSGERTVVGIGQSLVSALGSAIDGLKEPASHGTHGICVPSTPAALWCWLRGEDRGELLHRGRAVVHALADAFVLESVTDAFFHDTGRDLTGYEDGTENPKGEAAIEAAFVSGRGEGLDGSSFVAVQIWQHDLTRFEAMSEGERDLVVGRRRKDNQELADAPPSAHVKRTAQESFEPAAFVLRRSMPYTAALGEGLVFVAFGRSFRAFETQFARMLGQDDGILDALFRFTRPRTSSYFWCPPVHEGCLDLRALGL